MHCMNIWSTTESWFHGCLYDQETWAVYEKHAMGQDELMPLTLEGKSVFGDLAATLVDSLDTLWMMGLKPEFDR